MPEKKLFDRLITIILHNIFQKNLILLCIFLQKETPRKGKEKKNSRAVFENKMASQERNIKYSHMLLSSINGQS